MGETYFDGRMGRFMDSLIVSDLIMAPFLADPQLVVKGYERLSKSLEHLVATVKKAPLDKKRQEEVARMLNHEVVPQMRRIKEVVGAIKAGKEYSPDGTLIDLASVYYAEKVIRDRIQDYSGKKSN